MQPVILATGLQSSGSTLLSWCFLQRPDMDGTLDGDCDLIPLPPEGVVTPYLWYKTTISSFDLEEQIRLLEDEGRQVRPLLVTRDVRAVWISLMRKPYGRGACSDWAECGVCNDWLDLAECGACSDWPSVTWFGMCTDWPSVAKCDVCSDWPSVVEYGACQDRPSVAECGAGN
ncbi:MAG: hypothetical protein DSZ02_04625, partial [Gammaproteobacteria bacterium]